MKNNIQINIENFQSISEAELEFIQGINLIVGEGNSGKSATLRAVKGAILNPKGSQRFIKNGTHGLSVNISYQGNDITWSRTKKDSKYIINGEEYQKVGNSNLSKILDKSGFVLDENDKLMNVESELELPFPFDKNPADLFKLFEKSIFCVSDSALILKTIKADEDIVHKDKVNADIELSRFNNKLKALSELEDEIDLSKLKEGKVQLEEFYFQHDKLFSDYKQAVEGYKAAKQLKDTKIEIIMPDLTSYFKLVTDVEKLNRIKVLAMAITKTTPEVGILIDLSEFIKLKEDYKKLKEIENILNQVKLNTLKEIQSPNIEEYKTWKNDFIQYKKAIEAYKETSNNIKVAQDKQELLSAKLKEFKVCPLCGQELENE